MERMNLFQDNNKPQITFYFAECMEFPDYGEYKEFPTLAQAISLFEKCPGTLLNAVKCVGFILHDDSIYDDVKQPLMTSKHVLKDDINYISHYANTTLVQEAIKEAECYLRSKENSKPKITTGMFDNCNPLPAEMRENFKFTDEEIRYLSGVGDMFKNDKSVNFEIMEGPMPPAPIQDENRFICFRVEGKEYSLRIVSKEEMQRVKEEVNKNSKYTYDWFKEETGNHHWVLYNTDMYEISNDGRDRYLHYIELSGLLPVVPINATSCKYMFDNCCNMEELDLKHFNTENIINMDRMFEGCKSRLQLNLMCFNTKKVERMYRMFADCPKIELLDIRSFDLSSTTTLREMFSCDTSLSTIGISDSALAQIYRKEVVIKNIFSKCTNLRNIITESGEAVLQEPLLTEYSIATRHEILDGSTNKYESRYSRREMYEALTQNDLQNALAQEDPLTLVKQNSKTLDNRMYIAQLKLKGPKDFTIEEKVNLLALYAKKGEVIIKNLRITKNTLNTWKQQISSNTYNRYNKIKVSPNIALTRPIQNDDAVLALCIDPSQSYNYCNNVYNLRMQQDMARCKLDLRIRTNKNYEWFREETGDKHLVLFDTSMYKVKRIKGGPCFLHYIGDSTLAPELPINASSCAFMFAFRKDLKKINLSNFSTEGVVTTKGMFAFCDNLEELDTSLLNTEFVVDYTDMFRGCKALTQLDLCRFSLQSAKRTRGMFLGCTSLKEILTTKLFDTQDVLDGYKMFERCISLPNYRNNILVQSVMARPVKDGGYLTMTSKRVLAQDLKALQS